MALYNSGTQFDNTTLVRERWMYYDGAAYGTLLPQGKGLPTKEEARLTGNVGDSGNSTSSYGYDTYGNRTQTTDARGCTTTTAMDGSQALPARVTNCFNHTAATTYHPVFLQPASQTDANGQATTFEYDVLGRPTVTRGPLDGGSANGTSTNIYGNWGDPNTQYVAVIRTTQHGTANILWSAEYFDGLGRVWEATKQGPDDNTVIVSHRSVFDARGQLSAQTAPWFYFTQSNTWDPLMWTTFQYDVLGRQTFVSFPDGTFTQRTYDHHEITDRDRNGNIKITRLDSYHRTSQIEEKNGGASYLTDYFYNAADQLIKVINHLGHNTHNVYDYLGRKVAMCDPNMGTAPV